MTDKLPTFLTNKEVKNFVELYNKGYTVKEIQDKTGRGNLTIRQWLKKKKVKMRPRGHKRKKWNESTVTEIIDMANQGYSCETIAEQVGIGKRTLSTITSLKGLKIWERHEKARLATTGRNPLRTDEINHHKRALAVEKQLKIRELAKKGVTYTKIAQEVGCDRKTVIRYAPYKYMPALRKMQTSELD